MNTPLTKYKKGSVMSAGDPKVDAHFRTNLKKKLADYREWSRSRKYSSCRLVHYCGGDLVGSRDVPEVEVEAQIEGLVSEGFYVDWAENDGRLYLRVWEFGGPEPNSPNVFAVQPLASTEGLLPREDE